MLNIVKEGTGIGESCLKNMRLSHEAWNVIEPKSSIAIGGGRNTTKLTERQEKYIHLAD